MRLHHVVLIGLGLLAEGIALQAHADSGRLMPRAVPALYTQECAACHLAYPPGLLPAASWRRLMGGLGKHFGSDASLDPASVKQLSAWLEANAASYKRVSEEPAQDRITNSVWFARKHRKVDPAVWKNPAVKSAANCIACHPGAERADFDDDSVRLPAATGAPTARPRVR